MQHLESNMETGFMWYESKGPCSYVAYTEGLKLFPLISYFRVQVHIIWLHGPFASLLVREP